MITLILFPRVKPYLKDVIDESEYVLDIGLGITIFVSSYFFTILIGIKELVKLLAYTGIGGLDKTLFGFFFGFIKAYIISVCLFSGFCILVYNYSKMAYKFRKSYIFPYLEKGSNYLIKEFPNEKTYEDSKEKIEGTLIQN